MRRETAERLARLYPGAWRARFGPEFVDVLEQEPAHPRVLLDVCRAALIERLFDPSRLEAPLMSAYPSSVIALARRPSAFVPLLMSLAALTVVVVALATTGAGRRGDEGAAAHLFQLLIAGQAPLLALFLARRWGKERLATLTLLALQIFTIGLALFPVWYFHL